MAHNLICPGCGRRRAHGFARTRRIVVARLGGTSIETIAATENIHPASVRYHLNAYGILRKHEFYVAPRRLPHLGMSHEDMIAAGAKLRSDGFWEAKPERAEETTS